MFVVVNPNTRIASKIGAAITAGGDSYTASAFKRFLQSSGWANLNIPTAPTSVQTQTRADEFVRTIDGKDVIVMTGEPVNVSVTAAPKQQVQNFSENTVTLNVERVVAKVLVNINNEISLHEADMKLVYSKRNTQKYRLAMTQIRDINNLTSTAYLSDLTWTVVQGANDLYLLKKPAAATENITFEYQKGATPQLQVLTTEETTVKGKKIDKADFWQMVTPQYANFSDYYDYSGLFKNQASNTSTIKGFTVKQRTAFSTNPSTEYELVKADLQSDLRGQFVLPTLHKFSNSDALSGYRKGNTAYVMVRARITPQKYIDNNGKVNTAPLSPNTDLYYGQTTGYFYVNRAHVTYATKRGIPGQKAYKYTKGIVLYFSWLNPDEVNTPKNSPVVRNNLYHIHITGVEALGSNWNPLVPKGVNNLDPFPKDNPLEPETPRLAPHEPLNVYTPLPQPKGGALPQDNVWMTVKVNVVKWRIHSAPTDLSGL